MQIEELTLMMFAACNGIRIFAYLPQIHKAATDPHGASAISRTTWALFLAANTSTAFYALVNQSDAWLSACFAANAACCAAILVAAYWRGRRWARATAPVKDKSDPFPRVSRASTAPKLPNRFEVAPSLGALTRAARRRTRALATCGVPPDPLPFANE